MALTKKHIGHGKWAVYDGGVKIAGPLEREDAEARVLAPPVAPKGDRGKEYLARMNADLGKPFAEEMAEIRALLSRRHDEDETNIIMRQIEPIVKSGRQAGRRERMRFMVQAPSPRATSA